jgi:hypothetical protein
MKPSLLVLKNFQSLRERTEIPITPLTFLYGPNSAGKSCIDDAFTLIGAVLHEGATEQTINSMVGRWRHCASQAEQCVEDVDAVMLVELHFQSGYFRNAIYSGHANLQQLLESEDGLFGWFERAGWQFALTIECNAAGLLALTLSSGGESVFRIDFDRGDNDCGQLTITLEPFGTTFRSLVEKHLVSVEKHDQHFKIDCLPRFNGQLRLTAFDDEGIDWELANVINTMILDLAELITLPINLGADRATIPNAALSSIRGLTSDFFEATSFDMGLPMDSRFEFMRRLAESSYQVAFAEKNPLDAAVEPFAAETEDEANPLLLELQEFAASVGRSRRHLRPSVGEPIHVFVNRCLAEHLFLDQGYQLVFEALEIKPATDIEVPPLTAALMIGSLIDKVGRRMSFEDVGTGISCVIPVLVAVHSGNGFIQQPELHLHPALQSAMGDIFVEAIKVDHAYHFVETHSEYILLRCLRRVRETTAGKHPVGSPLALMPKDLTVLYFEPQPDGTTRVKNIRVSTQGDFIDRWPRGFFEERSKELFDE